METDVTTDEKQNFNMDAAVLPTEFIQDLVDQYRNKQLTYIDANLGTEDAHSIWFDLQTIKKFIAEIESEALRIDPHCQTKDLGIRLYYGAYSETPSHPIPQDYGKRHTIVMIPTKLKEAEGGQMLNFDFNPFEDKNSDNEQALALTPGALGQNHGALIPPNNSIVESY